MPKRKRTIVRGAHLLSRGRAPIAAAYARRRRRRSLARRRRYRFYRPGSTPYDIGTISDIKKFWLRWARAKKARRKAAAKRRKRFHRKVTSVQLRHNRVPTVIYRM